MTINQANPRCGDFFRKMLAAMGAAAALAGCVTVEEVLRPKSAGAPLAAQAAPSQTTPPASPPPAAVRNGDGPSAPLPYSASPRQTQATRTASEKQLAADAANFRSVVFGGFMTSMVSRGAPAAIACYARYANNKRALDQCLAAGLVAITIEGVNKGYSAAKLQEAGQNRVRAMEAVTADMAADNARLQSIVDASEAVLAESQARLTALRDEVRTKRRSADQAKQESQREQENLDTLNQALKDARSTREEYVKTAQNFRGTPAERRNLDAEIAAMTAKVKKLEANTKKLSDAMVPFSA